MMMWTDFDIFTFTTYGEYIELAERALQNSRMEEDEEKAGIFRDIRSVMFSMASIATAINTAPEDMDAFLDGMVGNIDYAVSEMLNLATADYPVARDMAWEWEEEANHMILRLDSALRLGRTPQWWIDGE